MYTMISFVLPVYNCFEKLISMLPALINRIELLKIDYEIIIVDDGSEKPVTISEYENDHCKLLINKKNYGKGYAVKRGVLHSSGDEIIFMDGDFPFDLSVIDIACKSIIKPGSNFLEKLCE